MVYVVAYLVFGRAGDYAVHTDENLLTFYAFGSNGVRAIETFFEKPVELCEVVEPVGVNYGESVLIQ